MSEIKQGTLRCVHPDEDSYYLRCDGCREGREMHQGFGDGSPCPSAYCVAWQWRDAMAKQGRYVLGGPSMLRDTAEKIGLPVERCPLPQVLPSPEVIQNYAGLWWCPQWYVELWQQAPTHPVDWDRLADLARKLVDDPVAQTLLVSHPGSIARLWSQP